MLACLDSACEASRAQHVPSSCCPPTLLDWLSCLCLNTHLGHWHLSYAVHLLQGWWPLPAVLVSVKQGEGGTCPLCSCAPTSPLTSIHLLLNTELARGVSSNLRQAEQPGMEPVSHAGCAMLWCTKQHKVSLQHSGIWWHSTVPATSLPSLMASAICEAE